MRIETRMIMHGLLGVFITLVPSGAALAQIREQYVISAKAGGVNLVSGNVTVRRQGVSGGRVLALSDDLQNGDVVTTGADGRVEVLLNPGSYFRAAENSEFELTDGSLDRLRLRLIRGSAVVEAAGLTARACFSKLRRRKHGSLSIVRDCTALTVSLRAPRNCGCGKARRWSEPIPQPPAK